MPFPTSISAAQFSRVTVARTTPPAVLNEAALRGLFTGLTTNTWVELPDIRDMPSVGTPANLVKVPQYGASQTLTIGAQSDAPDLEFMVNYVPSKWAPNGASFATTGNIADARGDGISKVFQVALMTAVPTNLNTVAGGIGTAPNYLIYFVGKIESLLINPSRDDAVTATVAVSIQSDFFGPFTI